jgi:hypothetical protein
MATQDERLTLRTTSPSNIFPQSHSTGRSPYVAQPALQPNPMREQLIAQIPTGDVQAPVGGTPVEPQNNVLNTANALGPLAGAGARGVLGLGRLAQAANTSLRGAPAAAGLAGMAGVVANEATQMAGAPSAAAPERVAPGAAAPIASGVAGTSDANPSNMQVMGTLRNNIVRNGNSYSSGDGGPITAGATINGQEGRGGISVVPGVSAPGGNAGIPAAPVSLRGAMPGSNDGGRWNGAMYRTGDQLRRDAEVQASSILPGTRRQGEQALAAQYRQEGIETEAASRMGAAAIGAESARYGADQRLRGDIFQSQGQRATAQAKLQMDAMQNDRQYGLDVARLGADRAKTQFEQRTKGAESVVKDLSRQFTTTDKDGKAVVNNEAVARATSALEANLTSRIAALERQGNKAAAEELRSGGIGALPVDLRQNIMRQTELQDISRKEGSSWNPFAGTNIEGDGLRIVGSERRTLRPNVLITENDQGARGTIPESAVNGRGVLPAAVNTRFNPLMTPAMQEERRLRGGY